MQYIFLASPLLWSLPPKQDVDPFSRVEQPSHVTDRLTDAAIIDFNSPHLTHSMRPNNGDAVIQQGRINSKFQQCENIRSLSFIFSLQQTTKTERNSLRSTR